MLMRVFMVLWSFVLFLVGMLFLLLLFLNRMMFLFLIRFWFMLLMFWTLSLVLFFMLWLIFWFWLMFFFLFRLFWFFLLHIRSLCNFLSCWRCIKYSLFTKLYSRREFKFCLLSLLNFVQSDSNFSLRRQINIQNIHWRILFMKCKIIQQELCPYFSILIWLI